MRNNTPTNTIILVLKVAAFFVFAGRSYQFLFFDAPFRVLLWDQRLMSGLVEFVLGMDWETYAASKQVDAAINGLKWGVGVLYALAALSTWFFTRRFSLLKWVIYGGVFFLVVLNLLEFKDRFFQLPMFMEHLTQIMTPLILVWYIQEKFSQKTLLLIGKITIALTFFSHGLYAIGFYPRPGKFIDLVIGTFHWDEQTATLFTAIAGWLDLLVAILVFLPRTSAFALIYMTIWGLVTASSRVTSGVYLDFFAQSLHQTLFLALYRLCHGLLPLSLWLIQRGTRQGRG